DSKEGGADGFVCRARPEANFSHLLTLGLFRNRRGAKWRQWIVAHQRFERVFGVAPLSTINRVSSSTALSMGRMSATSIGVLPRSFFSSSGAPLSARN